MAIFNSYVSLPEGNGYDISLYPLIIVNGFVNQQPSLGWSHLVTLLRDGVVFSH